MSAPENPRAFPFSAEYGHPAACGGMTLRDWFAGQALAGLAVNTAEADDLQWTKEHGPIAAYEIADAMLAAREQKA